MRLLRLIGRARQERSSRAAVRWLFLRALGAVYLIAFTSLRVQVLGLYGSRGIRPIGSCSPRFVPRRDAARISSLRRCCGSARRTATSSGSAGRGRSARSVSCLVWLPVQ